ncbi:MAG: hypothetical protein AAGH68_06245 [Pseudomonadota bacterium]
MRRLLGMIAVGLCLSGCVEPAQQRPPPTVDARFKTLVIKATRGGKELHFRYQVRRSKDGMRVCGAWAVRREEPRSALVQGMLDKGSVYIGDAKLVKDIAFMKRLRSPDQLQGEKSACRKSRVPWNDSMAGLDPELRFPSNIWY